MTQSEFRIETDLVDDTVLAVLWLTLHDGDRAWKGIDFDALERLHRKGMIGPPFGNAKSIMLTDEGLERAERAARKMFTSAQG